jgi:hypothetical protein
MIHDRDKETAVIEAFLATCFMLVCYMPYSSTLKVQTCSFGPVLDTNGLQGVIHHKIELLLVLRSALHDSCSFPHDNFFSIEGAFDVGLWE